MSRRFGVGLVALLLVGAIAAPAAAAGDGAHIWTRQLGTAEDDYVWGVAVDATGVYAVGETSGSLRGANKGYADGFVRKYGHDGKILWTRQFGTPQDDYVFGVAVDATGVYAGGETWGSLRGTSQGGRDGFVRKYDLDGKLLWTRQFGTPKFDTVYLVAADATGVYAVGSTGGSLKGTNQGSSDGFVRKYDPDGKLLWTRQFGTSKFDAVNTVAVDATGVYAAGETRGSLRGTNQGGSDGFVRKYGSNGKLLWTRQLGTTENDYIWGMAADATGVYAAGDTEGGLRGTNQGGSDGFVRKYGHDGKILWTRQFGTPQDDYIWGMAADATGVYAVGDTWGSLRGTNIGWGDGFVRRYDHDGKVVWTRQFGTSESDGVNGVAADATGVYAVGSTDGGLRGTNQGSTDGFVRKYGTG